MHNIVSESHRVARTYVGIFDWLVSYAVCELSFDGPNMTNSSGRMVKPESGIRNRSRKRNRNRNLNWDQGKLGSTETSSRYPCGNKIQDGVLCYHFFEKFSAQWSWYQRYNHIRKVTSNQKEHNHSNSKNQPMLFRRRLEHKFKHNNFTFSHVLTFQSIRRFVAICKRKQIRFCKVVKFFQTQ